MDQQHLEQWYWNIPLITRIYSTAAVITALAVQFKYVTPIQLYYHPDLVFYQFQWWRLIVNFFYFGSFGLDFIFHMFFMNRYLRLLEEEFYRHRKADFTFFLLFCVVLLLLLGPFFGLAFLGSALIYSIVYVWSKRNPFIIMNFLGLFNFMAPYLPFVLFGFSLLISNHFPLGDFLGIIVGHAWYFLDEIYPRKRGGRKLLKTPRFLKFLLNELDDEVERGQDVNLHAMHSTDGLLATAEEEEHQWTTEEEFEDDNVARHDN